MVEDGGYHRSMRDRRVGLFVVMLLSLSTAAAQPVTTEAPPPPPPPIVPNGIWEGTLACPTGPFPIQVVVFDNNKKKLDALIIVPAQSYSTEAAVTVSASALQVSGPVAGPNGDVSISGAVVGDSWSAALDQMVATAAGARVPFHCSGSLKRTSAAAGVVLDVNGAYQQTPMWCWLTVGQMLFEYYNVLPANSFSAYSQCQIMQTIYLGNQNFAACAANCGACAMLGGASTREVEGMIVDFPHRLSALTSTRVPRLFAATAGPLKPAEVTDELARQNPLVVAISPSQSPYTAMRSMNPFTVAQHVALLVGVLEVKGKVWYRINDPFPFQATGMLSPYLANGGLVHVSPSKLGTVSYWIRDDALRAGLKWSETFLVRRDGYHEP